MKRFYLKKGKESYIYMLKMDEAKEKNFLKGNENASAFVEK